MERTAADWRTASKAKIIKTSTKPLHKIGHTDLFLCLFSLISIPFRTVHNHKTNASLRARKNAALAGVSSVALFASLA